MKRQRKGSQRSTARRSSVAKNRADLVRFPSSTHIGHGSASPSAHSHAPIRACTIDVILSKLHQRFHGAAVTPVPAALSL